MPEGVQRKDIICILCPKGCRIGVTGEPREDGTNIEGAECVEGRKHAVREATNPCRLVCTSVEVDGGDMPLLSVRTAQAVPKGKVMDCLRELAGVRMAAPVSLGQIIVRDILRTGIDVIATREVAKTGK